MSNEIAGLGAYWMSRYNELERINKYLKIENTKLKKDLQMLRLLYENSIKPKN